MQYSRAWGKSVLALALALSFSCPVQAGKKLIGATESIPRNEVTGGGLLSTGGGFSFNSGLAQTSVSSFSGAGFRLYSGLMHSIAQPGSVVSIVSVTKTTGTLELAWSAPGLDGFLGSVNGFYRIDTSSDPLHFFDPTTFVTEFATSVAPGDAQAYVLNNLLPNTTYYTRVYLSDARKMVAETSKQSDQSTLANTPDPVFTGVFVTSVTVSWAVPVGSAEGYSLLASSMNFISGVTVSSLTQNGSVVTLTINGLNPDTTYYFNLGSLNWQSDLNFNVIVATRTRPGSSGPLPIANLDLNGDSLNHTVTLTWTNQAFPNPAGVTVLVSSMPIVATVSNGVAYTVGQKLSDGSTVKAVSANASYTEAGLARNTTTYFALYSKNISLTYSSAVSDLLVLNLPPMAPAGLDASVNASRSSIDIRWSSVFSALDGESFRVPNHPTSWEMDRYEVYRATGVVQSSWVLIGTTTWSALNYVADVPNPVDTFYYKIVSRNNYSGSGADQSMIIDTSGNLYAVSPSEHISRIKIPASMAGIMRAPGNNYGMPLLVRAHDRPQDVGGKVIKSISFDSVMSPSNHVAPVLMSNAGIEIDLRYETAGGKVVPSGYTTLDAGNKAPLLDTAILADNAQMNLASYLVNGTEVRKLFGDVNPFSQTVGVLTQMLGTYQIREVLRDAGFSFDVSGMSNKVLTPNGDGVNDTVVWVFDNPKDSFFSGKIFDVRGAFVADMMPGPVAASSLMWDGKASGGGVVPRGVYVYQIKGEDKVFNGTVVVIR